MKTIAIVLAAGKGSRMKQAVPKQFLEIRGYPVLYYSLKAFEESMVDEVILVTGAENITYCKEEIVEKYQFQKVREIVAGGSERYLSVYQGLCVAKEADVVLIHDGARPCVTPDIILRVIESVKKYGSGVTAVRAKDTISQADNEQFLAGTLDRSCLWNIQTPQAFWYADIFAAHQRVINGECVDKIEMQIDKAHKSIADLITDDASVLCYGSLKPMKIKFVEGSYQNIKVTTPEDLLIAELFLYADREP